MSRAARPELSAGARRVGPPLAAFALAVNLMHHVGAVPNIGELATVRVTDLIDLLTPYVVLVPAGALLLAADASRARWVAGLLAALIYTSGHGIHLAANSASNTGPVGRTADNVHLWDEVLGHAIWYGGLWGLIVVLVWAVRRQPLAVRGPGWLLAVAFGITHATNGLEGGTAPASLAFAVALAGWGARLGGSLGRLLLAAYVPAALLLAAYGIRYGGWPQPSAL